MAKEIAFLCLISLQLIGCDNAYTSPKYQVTIAQDGKAYRVNTHTGKVHLIKDTRLFEVSTTKETKLVVGNIYVTEDDELLKYVGSSKFKLLSSSDEDLIEYMMGL